MSGLTISPKEKVLLRGILKAFPYVMKRAESMCILDNLNGI